MGVYNAPLGMLDEAIDSILGQSFRDFEFLIVDDGSTDEALRGHLDRRATEEGRLHIAHEPHRGLTGSLNRGIELAQGEYIARQDADDWSAPERLARQVAHLEANPQDHLVGTNAWTHQAGGARLWPTQLPLTRDQLLRAFPNGNPFVHGSTMFRREAAIAAGGYREAFRCSQDYDFFWRLTERHGAANLPEPLYHYRYTSGSISASRAGDQLRAHAAIRKLADARRRGELEDPGAEMARATKDLATASDVFRALLKQADHKMLAGDYGSAAKAYLELLSGHPLSSVAWAKLARLGLFRTLPFAREALFT
jgi:glycosyltransferase involved in cell wall biosynthesis